MHVTSSILHTPSAEAIFLAASDKEVPNLPVFQYPPELSKEAKANKNISFTKLPTKGGVEQ